MVDEGIVGEGTTNESITSEGIVNEGIGDGGVKEKVDAVLKYREEVLQRYKEEQKRLLSNSDIPDDLIMYEWKDYKFDNNEQVDDNGNKIELSEEVIKSRREVWRACGTYCLNLQKMNDRENKEYPFASILLIGSKDSGKSVLGSLILREAMKRLRENVLYVPFGSLAVELSTASFDSHRIVLDETYCTPKILMIDEICDGYFISNKARDNLNYILTKRANYGIPTIITSKISYESIYHVVGIPAYRLIGKPEVYKHLTIMNTKRTNSADLLTANSHYPPGKIEIMIDRLRILKSINMKNNSQIGLYGDQIRDILDGGVRGNTLTEKQFQKMASIAKGIPQQKKIFIEVDETQTVDEVLNETKPSNISKETVGERQPAKEKKEKKEAKKAAKKRKDEHGLGE